MAVFRTIACSAVTGVVGRSLGRTVGRFIGRSLGSTHGATRARAAGRALVQAIARAVPHGVGLRCFTAALIASLLGLACQPAGAALTDIAQTPLNTAASTPVQPNLLFLLDNSGSMQWQHLPDDARDPGSTVTFLYGYYGLRSSQCNEIYYDPAVNYVAPVNALGVSYPQASFSAALPDGFSPQGSGNAPVNLSTSYRAVNDTTSGTSLVSALADVLGGPAYYYTYNGNQLNILQRNFNSLTNLFFQECGSGLNSLLGNSSFTRINVTGAAQQQNFANWYSYYRTRLNMMKTSAGLAFRTLDANYRVGFMALNNNNGKSDFVNFASFDAAQKAAWYNALYNIDAAGGTPLRKALSVAGQIYGGKVTSLYGNTVADPLQYSCQQNFTIMSTDGYWNGAAGTVLNSSAGVGNTDGGEPRPFYDGTVAQYSRVTSQLQQLVSQLLQTSTQVMSTTKQVTRQVLQLQTRTVQYQRTSVQQQQTVTQSTNARATVFINTVATTNSLTLLNVNGSSILNGPVYGIGLTPASLKTSLAANLASNLNTGSSGYSATSGSCTAANTPVTGCTTGDAYVTVSAIPGSGVVTSTITGGGTGVVFRPASGTLATFSGGSAPVVTSGPSNVAVCVPATSTSGQTTTVTSCPTAVSGPSNVATCVPSTVAGQVVTCTSSSDTGWVNTSSCSVSAAGSGPTTTCQTTDSGFVNAANCTPSGPSNGQTVNCGTNDGAPTAVSACTPSSANGQTVTCQTFTSGPTPVASCNNTSSSASNGFTTISCATNAVLGPVGVAACNAVQGLVGNNFLTTSCNTIVGIPTTVTSCVATVASASNNWTGTTCTPLTAVGGTSDTLADVAEYYYTTDLRTTNCTGAIVPPASTGLDVCENNVPQSGIDSASWQHMTTFTLGLGARGRMNFSPTYLTDTSGDYFDVRNGSIASATVCTWQPAGSVCNWPVPGISANGADGAIENVDDMWHAAVNGRGSYFNATNPTTLSAGLLSALAGVTVRTGGTAAVGVSSANPVQGDNFVFSSNFTSGAWTGELYRYPIDPVTLAPATVSDWEARGQLDARTPASRTIYTYDPGNAGTGLKSFAWTSLSTAEQAMFGPAAIATLTQLCVTGPFCLPVWQANHVYSAGDEYRNAGLWYHVNSAYTSGGTFAAADTSRATVVTGAANENLVNYLRGERSNEGTSSDAKYFRQRTHLLGDVVNAEAVFVAEPHYAYLDANYAAYKVAQANRQGMVYVGANDGMLHAFKAGSAQITPGDNAGAELWAYIPSTLLPTLYKLADKNYASQHQYYVDGTPTQADVFFDNAWHTILVGGLGGGGRAYYALDVTDPNAPKALWEFSYDTSKGAGYTTDANLGYTYGRPVVTKLKNGQWVVLVTSGYNNGDNAASPGDGRGYLYVLNVKTGAKISAPIGTGAGSVTAAAGGCSSAPCPSGLGQIAQYADYPSLNNTARRVYGGDLFGNLWRFDIDDNIPPAGNEATLLATLRGPANGSNPGGNVQPLTAKPVLGTVGGNAIVYVGTGRLLGLSDLSDLSQQTLYAIKDTLGTSGVGNPRAGSGFIKQTLSAGTCPSGAAASVCGIGQLVRTSANLAVDLTTDKGWYVDLPDAGERSNVDPALALGTLVFNSNIPTSNACTAGGYSYTYAFNYLTGSTVSTASAGVVGVKLGNGLASRPVLLEGVTGKVIAISHVDGSGSYSAAGAGKSSSAGNAGLTPGGAIKLTDGSVSVTDNVVTAPPIVAGTSGLKRVSWRELVD